MVVFRFFESYEDLKGELKVPGSQNTSPASPNLKLMKISKENWRVFKKSLILSRLPRNWGRSQRRIEGPWGGVRVACARCREDLKGELKDYWLNVHRHHPIIEKISKENWRERLRGVIIERYVSLEDLKRELKEHILFFSPSHGFGFAWRSRKRIEDVWVYSLSYPRPW
jgi:hypothetical protein